MGKYRSPQTCLKFSIQLEFIDLLTYYYYYIASYKENAEL